jgi:hypothetical protein
MKIDLLSLYHAVNTFDHGYENHLVKEVYTKYRCLFRTPYKTKQSEL